MTTTKKTPTKQSKREAKAAEKAKSKKPTTSKSASKGKCPFLEGNFQKVKIIK
jgi:hypothetical protein